MSFFFYKSLQYAPVKIDIAGIDARGHFVGQVFLDGDDLRTQAL
jgi:hypothetical protein